ncbi:hypothetical protein [Cyclobacterium lianum]|uniref:hypothetical protein n=1 Tax=Cyclobacterium lianum TaxID=388280 RepID=UPI0011609BA7|nr:hypothetical protein [Cyclobacterium lianum]
MENRAVDINYYYPKKTIISCDHIGRKKMVLRQSPIKKAVFKIEPLSSRSWKFQSHFLIQLPHLKPPTDPGFLPGLAPLNYIDSVVGMEGLEF